MAEIYSPTSSTIEDLPDEVLEYIMSLIPPYKDIHNCMQVSKRWRRCVRNVVRMKMRNLHKAIVDFDIKWQLMIPQGSAPIITKRYSHSAVMFDNSMYVFGGCTNSMTTFNDLWRLDLSTREWIRPVTKGNYPSPKACSSLARYKDTLVLFGGWTYPPSYPLYQSWHLFNELHTYNIKENRWCSVTSTNSPPPMAGHSVSIIGDSMIVFGGLQRPEEAVHCEKSNDLWRLSLVTWEWEKITVAAGPKPNARVGQTQVLINDENILIMGGSGGPNLSFGDVWVLNMSKGVWRWKQIALKGERYRPSNIWSNPGCKIGDKVVVLNRIREAIESPLIVYYPKNTWLSNRTDQVDDGKSARIDLATRREDRDENVNGRRGTLRNHKRGEPEDGPNEPGPSNAQPPDNVRTEPPIIPPAISTLQNRYANSPRRRSEIRRERRLAALEKLNLERERIVCRSRDLGRQHMGIYVLDIAKALDAEPYATWLQPKNYEGGPEETVLYSLVEGKSELVMFGGIQQEAGTKIKVNLSNQISNTVHFITAPNFVI